MLTKETINRRVIEAEYAVRGEIAIRAEQIKIDIENGIKFPFSNIVNCNIGNPQQLGQKLITFFRQVACLTEYPKLMDNEDNIKGLFEKDSITRAKKILKNCGGSIGAYSQSQGVPYLRQNIANFLKRRDGHEASIDHIFLTSGASQGVQLSLQILLQHPKVGVLIPIPQYPLYTASLCLYGGVAVSYYLDEEKGWSLNLIQLENSLNKAKEEDIDVRAMVVINPGNPTGNVLSIENMQDVVKFCHKNSLILMADEVYQTNIYYPKERPFISFRKVVLDMPGINKELELISFHSISKGMVGECGRRGGFLDLVNFDLFIVKQIYKVCSIMLCPNLMGQIVIDLMVNPPVKNDPSYELYTKEIEDIFESLVRRAKKLCDSFNSVEGVSCQPAYGALYLFPKIEFPSNLIKYSNEKLNKIIDNWYCLEMLNKTGVCMVPGSGFGQKEGTYHFRTTILPQEDLIDNFVEDWKKFHVEFINQKI